MVEVDYCERYAIAERCIDEFYYKYIKREGGSDDTSFNLIRAESLYYFYKKHTAPNITYPLLDFDMFKLALSEHGESLLNDKVTIHYSQDSPYDWIQNENGDFVRRYYDPDNFVTKTYDWEKDETVLSYPKVNEPEIEKEDEMFDVDYSIDSEEEAVRLVDKMLDVCDYDLLLEIFNDAEDQMNNTIGTLEITGDEVCVLLLVSKIMEGYFESDECTLPDRITDKLVTTFEAITDQMMSNGISLDLNPLTESDQIKENMFLRLNTNQFFQLASCLSAVFKFILTSPMTLFFENFVVCAKKFLDSVEGYSHWLIKRAASLSDDTGDLLEQAINQIKEVEDE